MTATSWPCDSKRRAHARPIPRAPPVTRTTLFAWSCACSLFSAASPPEPSVVMSPDRFRGHVQPGHRLTFHDALARVGDESHQLPGERSADL